MRGGWNRGRRFGRDWCTPSPSAVMLGGAGCAHLGERAKIRGRHLGKGNVQSSLRWAPPPQSTEAVHVSSLTTRADQHLTGAMYVCKALVHEQSLVLRSQDSCRAKLSIQPQHTDPKCSDQRAPKHGLHAGGSAQLFQAWRLHVGHRQPREQQGGGSKLPVKAHPMLFKGS